MGVLHSLKQGLGLIVQGPKANGKFVLLLVLLTENKKQFALGFSALCSLIS